MKKGFLSMMMSLLIVGVLASGAMAVTMQTGAATDINSIYKNQEFTLPEITIAEESINEFTNGDYCTLILPDGVIWDQDNVKVYHYIDSNMDNDFDTLAEENSEYKFEDDRKLKITVKNARGNWECYKIVGSVKLFNFEESSLSLTLWKNSFSNFHPTEIIVANNQKNSQGDSIGISVLENPVTVTVGDKKAVLAPIRIAESSMGCFQEDSKIKLSIVTPGVIFEEGAKDENGYYYPIAWRQVSGDNIFSTAKLGTNQNAEFSVMRRSDATTSIDVLLRSITIQDNAQPGAIKVRVEVGSKTQEVVVGNIIAKSSTQIAQEVAAAANAAALKPQIGRSIFKLNSLQYTFMDQNYIMSSAPYSRNGVSFISGNVLSRVLGITESNYIWNAAQNRLTLKAKGLVLEMSVGSTAAILNGEHFTLNYAPEFSGVSIMLPLRDMANIFGYSVQWVQNTKSIILDPKTIETSNQTSTK